MKLHLGDVIHYQVWNGCYQYVCVGLKGTTATLVIRFSSPWENKWSVIHNPMIDWGDGHWHLAEGHKG